MLKKILVVCCLIMLALPVGGKALAAEEEPEEYEGQLINTNQVQAPNPFSKFMMEPLVDQLPNAEFRLATYTSFNGTGYSAYCTATQSHINLRISNSKGIISAWLQRRGPNQSWTTVDTVGEKIHKGDYHTFNMNAVKGHDYRLKIKGEILAPATGSIYCW